MASSRGPSPNLSTVVSALHLIFTLASAAFLLFKVYSLECELSSIRGKIFSGEDGLISLTEATPLSVVPKSEEQLRGERDRRRVDRKKLESPPSDKLEAVCVKKLLNNLQVTNSLFSYDCFLSQRT